MTLISCVKSIELEGHRLEVWERDDGFFQFVESQQTVEPEPSFWSPVRWSGIYATAAGAERDALQVVPWLRDQDRCQGADA